MEQHESNGINLQAPIRNMKPSAMAEGTQIIRRRVETVGDALDALEKDLLPWVQAISLVEGRGTLGMIAFDLEIEMERLIGALRTGDYCSPVYRAPDEGAAGRLRVAALEVLEKMSDEPEATEVATLLLTTATGAARQDEPEEIPEAPEVVYNAADEEVDPEPSTSDPLVLEVLPPEWFPDRDSVQLFVLSPRYDALFQGVSVVLSEDLPDRLRKSARDAACFVCMDLQALARAAAIIGDGTPLKVVESHGSFSAQAAERLHVLAHVATSGDLVDQLTEPLFAMAAEVSKRLNRIELDLRAVARNADTVAREQREREDAVRTGELGATTYCEEPAHA